VGDVVDPLLARVKDAAGPTPTGKVARSPRSKAFTDAGSTATCDTGEVDFAFDAEIESIRHEARRLADRFDDEYWRTHDEKHEFPWEFYNAFAEQGWIGIVVTRPCSWGRPHTARAFRMRHRPCTFPSLEWGRSSTTAPRS
jgi:hypothetical protein